MRTYKLPDGKITRSLRRYRKVWSDLASDCCKAFGPDWTPLAVDPGVAICRQNGLLLVRLQTGAALDLAKSVK